MLVGLAALVVATFMGLVVRTDVLAAEGKPEGQRATAVLQPTQGNSATGRVEFTKGPGGVTISAELQGLKPGPHGFHVHEKGDCSAPDASSAGGHFNPTTMPHAGPDADKRHDGDLGNVTADASGKAELTRVDKHLELSGDRSIVGRALAASRERRRPRCLRRDPSEVAAARSGHSLSPAVQVVERGQTMQSVRLPLAVATASR
jgi:Cu/Zn superoxide dismutase